MAGMSYREFFTSPPCSFLATERRPEEADWAVLGVPLDATSTGRPGSRYGPTAIRMASLALEVRSLITGSDLGELRVSDLGDLHVSLDVAETLERLELVASEVLKAGLRLAVLGGEHTIALGVVRGLKEALELPKAVILDAHLDLRGEYQGRRLCHATVVRRLVEELGPDRVAVVGARVCSKEELAFAREAGLAIIGASEVREGGAGRTVKLLKSLLSLPGPLHLSLDLDVLDPSFAPAVQTPEPFGLRPEELLELVLSLCQHGLVSLDMVELAPAYDQGQTALLAARLLAEVMWATSREA
ncbi:agmatinase [Candidatus Bathyarchaeota archaeon]|nr:MAG: agmatinase [Candidatus Bathyarchaeota archaeon]